MKTDKKKFLSDMITVGDETGGYLTSAGVEYAEHIVKSVTSFGLSLKELRKAIMPPKKPGDKHDKGRTMTAQEWVEFKKEEKENVGKN